MTLKMALAMPSDERAVVLAFLWIGIAHYPNRNRLITWAERLAAHG